MSRIFYKAYSERQMKKTVYLNLLGMVLQQLIGAAENERQLQLAGGAIPARCLFCNVAIAEQLNCNSYIFSRIDNRCYNGGHRVLRREEAKGEKSWSNSKSVR